MFMQENWIPANHVMQNLVINLNVNNQIHIDSSTDSKDSQTTVEDICQRLLTNLYKAYSAS
jgi:phosphoribosylformylglycinamidine (FGAM) synthase PurS component